MRFASLGSGSQGNALIVAASSTTLLIDNGFSVRTAEERLSRLGLSADSLTALLVTHEHTDHIAGVFRFANKHQLPVYLTQGTLLAVVAKYAQLPRYHCIDSHTPFALNDLEIHAFPVPHDAREPVQYCFSDGVYRLGLLTDTGMVTQHILTVLAQCDALILECNHDTELLRHSSYPSSLKRRISGGFGHLSNEQAAHLLQQIDTHKLQHIIAAHLSEQNNTREHAVCALANALNCHSDWIGVADQEQGLAWRELGTA